MDVLPSEKDYEEIEAERVPLEPTDEERHRTEIKYQLNESGCPWWLS